MLPLPELKSSISCCTNGIRLVCWNVGSLATRYPDILVLGSSYGADLVCVQEIGQLDPVLFRSFSKIRGFTYARLWYCARQGGKGGGVAVVALNPKLHISEVGRLARGGISLRVSIDGCSPFAIINTYLPPIGSPYREDADLLRTWLPTEVARLRSNPYNIRDVIIAADWNDRQGNRDRFTDVYRLHHIVY